MSELKQMSDRRFSEIKFRRYSAPTKADLDDCVLEIDRLRSLERLVRSGREYHTDLDNFSIIPEGKEPTHLLVDYRAAKKLCPQLEDK